MNDETTNWRHELALSLSVSAQVILTGNIHDKHPRTSRAGYETTLTAMVDLLEAESYEVVLLFDPVSGLRVLGGTDADLSTASAVVGRDLAGGALSLSPVELADILPRIIPTAATSIDDRSALRRVALIIEDASRLRDPEYPAAAEVHELLSTAAKLAHNADPVYRAELCEAALFNQIIWLVDRQQDLPHWLSAIDPVRVVSIPATTLAIRLTAARGLAATLPGGTGLDAAGLEKTVNDFARLTDGMTIRSMIEVCQLATAQGIDATDISQAVRLYQIGLRQSPWRHPNLRDRIANAPTILESSVRGQAQAIAKSTVMLTKAYEGLSGAHLGESHQHRPQGVLLFAGPTGVGKTELVKAMAKLIFGTAESCIRFDMSEYSTEHSEARLIGAPPGYSGHNAGGELTNAVRERPFSILLFDEFEKAHPSILDKFLQILEDGRLTDGNGSTVHFSETLIVFTTNLGMYEGGAQSRRPVVTQKNSPEEVRNGVEAAIHRHFEEFLTKAEWLNRVGKNIVVFDFIRPPVVPEIVDKFTTNLTQAIKERVGLRLEITAHARDQLVEGALETLNFGGRGIASVVEQRLVEPLSSRLFAEPPDAGSTVTVSGVHETALGWELELA